MRICRTTRSCIASRQGYGAVRVRSSSAVAVSGQLDTPRRGRASHTTIPCSTASSRSRDAGWPAPSGAESSSRPSRGCTRSIDSNGPPQSTCTQPRSIGLMCAITSLTGRDRWLRKICLSVRCSAVRFFPRGVRSGIHRPCRLRIRRTSKPRNPKLSPCVSVSNSHSLAESKIEATLRGA